MFPFAAEPRAARTATLPIAVASLHVANRAIDNDLAVKSDARACKSVDHGAGPVGWVCAVREALCAIKRLADGLIVGVWGAWKSENVIGRY